MTINTWTTQFDALAEYVRINNRLPTHNSRIPKAERDPVAEKLADFVTRQRPKRESLSPEQRAALEGIPGFVWKPHTDAWDSNVKYFADFFAKHGRAPSPSSKDKREKRVADWASEQRGLIKGVAGRNPPTAERQKQLTALPGWAPRTPAQIQSDRLGEFTDFVSRAGRAPRRLKASPDAPLTPAGAAESALSTWLSNQRKKQREGVLDARVEQVIGQLLGNQAFPNSGK
ncbi:helicase associated domain-containing protein [Leifsonia sp. Root4]|uniref:helicase associated domain-containing protein n=1 Tax=Leifsonia sp. Root4 TaxID=1736525 RepID=UPI000A56C01E|nr:helicase associated domain-containing protein [Leifsonia sp. Root4]